MTSRRKKGILLTGSLVAILVGGAAFLSAAGTTSAGFRNYEPWTQKACLRDQGLLREGYRLFYDTLFRIVRAERIRDGQAVESWAYSYTLTGSRARAFHYKDGLLQEAAEYDASGRLFRKHWHGGMTSPQKTEEYVYGNEGRLMVIKGFKGDELETISEVRYHPSGEVLMHVIYHSGNAVVGRTLFETDKAGRVVRELQYRWGRLQRIIEPKYCPHGLLLEMPERAPGPDDAIVDPFFTAPDEKKP